MKTYLQGLQWDGVERVDRWLSIYLGTEDTEYSRAVGSRWLISAVARIFRPGAKADCCLILEARRGFANRRLCAHSRLSISQMSWQSSGAKMRRCKRGACGSLSLLDGLSHSEVARIKAFMSGTADRFRPQTGNSGNTQNIKPINNFRTARGGN